jgi:hypothetical protein
VVDEKSHHLYALCYKLESHMGPSVLRLTGQEIAAVRPLTGVMSAPQRGVEVDHRRSIN